MGRVLRPGGPFVVTFSNRCFPTKAVHGWLATDDEGRAGIVTEYFRRAGAFAPATAALLHAAGHRGRSPVRGVGDQTGGRR